MICSHLPQSDCRDTELLQQELTAADEEEAKQSSEDKTDCNISKITQSHVVHTFPEKKTEVGCLDTGILFSLLVW